MPKNPYPFSVDIGGEWSPRQAEKVIKRLQSEADALGVKLETMDVTVIGDSRGSRVLIVPLPKEDL